jgi:folate-binding protein YgfZ
MDEPRPVGQAAPTPGRMFADRSSWRKVGVGGADAIEWLDDLLTADLSGLGPNRAARALLLSPTGRIRADVTVAVTGGLVLLIQEPIQPDPIDRLLSPYVLSSDVDLHDRTADLCLFALPDWPSPPDAPGAAFTTPSCLGPGFDLTASIEDHARLTASLSKAFTPATEPDIHAWRVERGIARFGIDALPEDLPQEGGLIEAVAFDKGCYLGQEAVAKVRNLGHPRRLLLHLTCEGPVAEGDPVLVGEEKAGVITSAAAAPNGSVVLARVGWDQREAPLATPSGYRLRRALEPAEAPGTAGR